MNIIMKNGEFNRDLWYYLAGPMTGQPEYNFPAFEEAQKLLDAENIKVRSPHEIDHGQHEMGHSYTGMVCGKLVTRFDSFGREYGDDCGEGPSHPIHSKERGVLPYTTYMKAGYRMLLGCEGIILLKGWTDSKGTKNEVHVARSLQYPVFALGDGFLMELPTGSNG